jgi:sulfopyruvate decarboxylase subunit beta
LKRFDCLKILSELVDDELVVTNVGDTVAEWHFLKPKDSNLCQAGIGNVTPVGLGLSLALPRRKVLALDGDGSLLLNPGVLATIALQKPKIS